MKSKAVMAVLVVPAGWPVDKLIKCPKMNVRSSSPEIEVSSKGFNYRSSFASPDFDWLAASQVRLIIFGESQDEASKLTRIESDYFDCQFCWGVRTG